MFIIRRKADGFFYKGGSFYSKFGPRPDHAQLYKTRYTVNHSACSVPYDLWKHLQGGWRSEEYKKIWNDLYEILEVEVKIKEKE